jgi:uncharacterized radical SAM protein YgiQ
MMTKPQFLPTTKKEMELRGWDQADVILITGDAYIDHPSFGAAVIGRIIEQQGYKVAILPQPNWRDDLRDFKKLGAPRLFFGITAGNMDSMVNHYTALKRIRTDDAYTPGNVAGFRSDDATIQYTRIVKELFPDTPVIIGGVEASMRRLSHYDYWRDQFRPSILVDSKADLLIYGMGEKPIIEVLKAFQTDTPIEESKKINQVAYLTPKIDKTKLPEDQFLVLQSFQKELSNKRVYGENFVAFETESNKMKQRTIIQPYGKEDLVINPPFPPLTTEEMDQFALFKLMTNQPHPKYDKRGPIPAFEMIKNSITIHRGCFGGCSFCAIAAHQGKFISSRSENSILEEVKHLSERPYFKGHISDLGGPSANMYRMGGISREICEKCQRPSCIFPTVCKNLNMDHHPLIDLYDHSSSCPKVNKITIGSGIRYDMLVTDNQELDKKFGLTLYMEKVIQNHVSGRLKVAPEHTETTVLQRMRKPPFNSFIQFYKIFIQINNKFKKNQQLIPYFISSHPDCSNIEMAQLAIEIKRSKEYPFLTHQKVPMSLPSDHVQDFTPTPMTYSTAMFYLGFDPYNKKKVTVARTMQEKRDQNTFFFYFKRENREKIRQILQRNGRIDLYQSLYQHFFGNKKKGGKVN